MTTEKRKPRLVSWSRLKPGTIFRYEGKCYLRINHSDSICMLTFEQIPLYMDIKVEPITKIHSTKYDSFYLDHRNMTVVVPESNPISCKVYRRYGRDNYICVFLATELWCHNLNDPDAAEFSVSEAYKFVQEYKQMYRERHEDVEIWFA